MIKKNLMLKAAVLSATLALLPPAILAGGASSYELPDTAYLSNAVVDMIEHNGGIWLATDEGVNFSFDNGETWYVYDAGNGLPSSTVSAIYSIATGSGKRIWVATGHDEEAAGQLYSLSDGVSFSDDNGNNWTQINFGADGLNIPFVWGVDRTIYDITGHFDAGDPDDDWMFFAAFAGGFLASRDGGQSWRRIFASRSDSVQYFNEYEPPSLRNRYFSCATDTSHGDSLFVWAGTASGFFQYIFAHPRDKIYSKRIDRIVYCDNCPCDGCADSNFVYFAGDAGFSRSRRTGGPYITRFEEDGLPAPAVISLIDFGDLLFAGTVDPFDSSGAGLAWSDNFGESFSSVLTFAQIGPGKRIKDFAALGDRLYMAAEEAGLWVTRDTGVTWTPVIFDAPDLAAGNRRNVVHAVEAWGDTLRLGTDSGLVQLYLDPLGVIDSSRFTVFPETDSSGAQIVRVKTQVYQGTDVIWTAHRALTVNGTPIVGRSADGGVTFDSLQVGVRTHDFAFIGDTAYVVGDAGIRFTPDGSNPGLLDEWIVRIREYSGTTVVDSLIGDILTTMAVDEDTIFIGCDSGFAVSFNRGATWDIRRPNTDSLSADLVLNYTSDIQGLLGNFIPALEIQYMPDTTARVWVSNRPTGYGREGISVGRIDMAIREYFDSLGAPLYTDTAFIYNWDSVYHDFAWNFAFNGDTVFAATNEGVIWSSSDTLLMGVLNWRALELVDSLGVPLVLEGTPVYAIEVVGNYLWVGTGDRTVRINLDDFDDQTPYFVVDPADEVYAFPVPFSHTMDAAVDFHFVVRERTGVTIEIYDFAMNLVRRVIDNVSFEPGIYPTVGGGRPIWDGRNGKGDQVAVGVYYFRVEYSTGDVQWGKLAVIP